MSSHTSAECMSRRDTAVTATVFVIDPDPCARASLETLIRREGWHPALLTSAEEFAARDRALTPSCLVSEISLPGSSGLELQARLAGRSDLPIIFLTNRSDIPMAVRAMRAGAVEFLVKPLRDDMLVDAIRCALELSRMAIPEQAELRVLRERCAALSPREHEVMALVVSGLSNKRVADQLGISEITVKAHRGRVMRKMAVRSLAQLVVVTAKLDVSLRWSVGPSVSRVPIVAPLHDRAHAGAALGR